MKVLLTGAFGNVGQSTINELARRGHQVCCFDLPTHANRRMAGRFIKQYGAQLQVVWGDLRCPQDVVAAVCDRDVVVHLAFIIPKMSATGIECERAPDWAREVNVGGTAHLLSAIKAQPFPPKLIFTSSYHVFGPTQDQAPPRTILDPVRPVEHYSRHKVECERMVHASGLTWTIFRLAAVLPFAIQLDPGMFDVPLDNRMEYIHSHDVALAIANAIVSDQVWGRLLLIGGGPRCQYYFREIATRILETVGVGMLPDEAFGTEPFPTDWLDTAVSQQLLQYQQRTLDDYLLHLRVAWRTKRLLVSALRPWIRRWLLHRSPHYVKAHKWRMAAENVEQAPESSADAVLVPGVLSPEFERLVIETARDLKGRERRRFMARVVKALGRDGQQRAEREFGWSARLIASGMRELEKRTA